jgi:hypothetical protein
MQPLSVQMLMQVQCLSAEAMPQLLPGAADLFGTASGAVVLSMLGGAVDVGCVVCLAC